MENFRMVINGEKTSAVSGKTIDVLSPLDGIVFGSIPEGDAEDIARAVESARAAFEKGDWNNLTGAERGRILTRLGSLVQANADDLAQLESQDTGKPLAQAVSDVNALLRYIEFYAGAGDKVGGETLPAAAGFAALTLREAHGVVGAILPWNYPAQMFGRVVIAALTMGNSVVVKPAEDACLSILRVAELALEAGLPKGVLNIVTGYGETAGAALAEHPDVNFVSFTGSPRVGSLVQAAAGRHYAGVTLELGGKSPHVVFEDADIDLMLPMVMGGIVQNSGQTCAAGSRILIQESIWDTVIEKLTARFNELVSGTDKDGAQLGPLINARQLERVNAMLGRAEEAGAKIVARGTIAETAPKGGFYVPAMLVAGTSRDAEIALEEVFGPVLVALPFKDEADAIALANGTEYGLVAAVWTRDGGRGLRVTKAIRAGQVFVNTYGAGGGVELPFGGVGKSGHGREKGLEALREFSVTKTVVINHNA